MERPPSGDERSSLASGGFSGKDDFSDDRRAWSHDDRSPHARRGVGLRRGHGPNKERSGNGLVLPGGEPPGEPDHGIGSAVAALSRLRGAVILPVALADTGWKPVPLGAPEAHRPKPSEALEILGRASLPASRHPEEVESKTSPVPTPARSTLPHRHIRYKRDSRRESPGMPMASLPRWSRRFQPICRELIAHTNDKQLPPARLPRIPLASFALPRLACPPALRTGRPVNGFVCCASCDRNGSSMRVAPDRPCATLTRSPP